MMVGTHGKRRCLKCLRLSGRRSGLFILRADNRQLKIPPMTQDGVCYFRFFCCLDRLSESGGFSFQHSRTSSFSVSWKSAANKFSLPECWWKTICTLDDGDKTSILCLDDSALHPQPNPQPSTSQYDMCFQIAFKDSSDTSARKRRDRSQNIVLPPITL